MSGKLRVLAVGLGNMGMSHAKAYARIDGFEVAAVCERRIAERNLPPELAKAQRFSDYGEALKAVKPDVVAISTWSDSHAEYAIAAMEAGAHVFVEKPLADTVEDAQRASTLLGRPTAGPPLLRVQRRPLPAGTCSLRRLSDVCARVVERSAVALRHLSAPACGRRGWYPRRASA